MREQKVPALTPEDESAWRKAIMCLHVVLRDDADRKSAFLWPEKHEHKMPSRLDTHKMLASRLPDPCRRTMAREREPLSPMTRAVTTEAFLAIGLDDGSPQVRRMHAASAS